MAKSDRIKKVSGQDAQDVVKMQDSAAVEPKKARKAKVEPAKQQDDAGILPEPEDADATANISDAPDTDDTESGTQQNPLSPEEMRKKAEAMEADLRAELQRIAAEQKAYEEEIQALREAAEAAEAEERAKKEAEEKAEAEAEARERAKAEAKAKAEADLLASINGAERHVGKAYKWWDYETGTWNLTTDVWSANQLSDKWEVVYVWYEGGGVERLLNKEELKKYCPR